MFPSRRHLIKFIKLLRVIVIPFFLSLLIALVHITLTINIYTAILGLTLIISGAIKYLYNEKSKINKHKLESTQITEIIGSQITVEATVHQQRKKNDEDNFVDDSLETTHAPSRTISTDGGTYNEYVGRDAIGRDLVNKNIKNITIGNREVEINPNNIYQTFEKLRDILAQSIAQSSDALEAISDFARELTEELRNRPDVKIYLDGDKNINEQESIKRIFKFLLTHIDAVIENTPMVKSEIIQQINSSDDSAFIENFEKSTSNSYDFSYKNYSVSLSYKSSRGWRYKIKRPNGNSEMKSQTLHSRNVYYAIARAVEQIDDEIDDW